MIDLLIAAGQILAAWLLLSLLAAAAWSRARCAARQVDARRGAVGLERERAA